MRKSVVYLVVVPTAVSSASNLALPLKKYFRELSITFKVSFWFGVGALFLVRKVCAEVV